MRSFFILNCLLIPLVFVSGKSRLGEYYTGFGFGVVDEATNAFEGDNFNVLLIRWLVNQWILHSSIVIQD